MARLARLVSATAWWLLLITPILAQQGDDAEALKAQVIKLYEEGKLEQAWPIAERYADTAKDQFGPNHSEYASALYYKGQLLTALNRFAEAEQHYRSSLTIDEKNLSLNDPRLVAVLEGLGQTLWALNRLADAVPIYQRLLDNEIKAPAPDLFQTAARLNRLATVYSAMGKLGEARPLKEHALAMWKGLITSISPALTASAGFESFLYNLAPTGDHSGETIALERQLVAIRERVLSRDNPDIPRGLQFLANLYAFSFEFERAEVFYEKAISLWQKSTPSHPELAETLHSLGSLKKQRGHLAEAESLYQQALIIRRNALPPDHPDLVSSLGSLASIYAEQGRFAESERLCKQVLQMLETTPAENAYVAAVSINNLANIYFQQGRYGEAEPLQRRANDILANAKPLYERFLAEGIGTLAMIFTIQGRYGEAEPLFQKVLEIEERVLSPSDPVIAISMNNLAMLYFRQGRITEAANLSKTVLTIREKFLPGAHPDVAISLSNLATIYVAQGRVDDAIKLYNRSLAILEQAFGSSHPAVATALNNLGELYRQQGRFAEAEQRFNQSLSIHRKVLGTRHPDIAASLNNLAGVYRDTNRLKDAESLYRQALTIQEASLNPDNPDIATIRTNIAWQRFFQKDWPESLDLLQRALDVSLAGPSRRSQELGQALTGQTMEKLDLPVRVAVSAFVKAAWALSENESSRQLELMNRSFKMVQKASLSKAATSLAQMSARQAAGASELSRLVRERQDLVREWQAIDRRLVTVRSQNIGDNQTTLKKNLVARLEAINSSREKIDNVLGEKFTSYNSLVNPKPLSIAEAQDTLAENEALILFFDTPHLEPTPNQTFIWVISKQTQRWVHVNIATEQLADRIATLRCGLDSTNWTDASKWSEATEDAKRLKNAQITRRERCKSLTGVDVTDRAGPPFDVVKAHDTYKAFFGEIEDLLMNPDGTAKQLFVVPSGPLTQLPIQVLVTQKPDAAMAVDYANTAWLIKRHAITTLPSVASLKALRQNAKSSKAERPFAGFGNPLLVGRDGIDKRAFAKQSCVKDASKPDPIVVAGRGLPETFTNLLRGGVADVAALRRQAPLPETADELCAVARELGADEADVNLGARATETKIKQLNTEGALAQARIVHFATHGLIASETESIAKSLAEPALLLTPPDAATATDDGLLTASEVTELKLNADWVVLSACNTAAGGEKGDAEALSGLARAFFYAGAHALLVSHWYVDSQAAVKITTGAFSELKRDPAIGRSEALRRAMLAAMTDTSRPTNWTPAAHPAVWAPFVVVGEGGAGR